MSRIGKQPINIVEGVLVKVEDNVVSVEGKLGSLSQKTNNVTVSIKDRVLRVDTLTENKNDRKFQGLYRSLIANMIQGVSQGFVKELELIGVGYRASNSGQNLELSLGHSHNIVFRIPDEVKVETKMEKGKPPYIRLSSFDKQLLGLVAAKIRSFRKIEPYKGKGVKFLHEKIRRKARKSTAK